MSVAAHSAPRERNLPRIPWTRIRQAPVQLLARMKPAVVSVRSAALHVGGLGALSTAAWGFDWRAGTAAVGVSLLVLEYLTHPEPDKAGGR
jgi:hypothetical protein